ncbi:DUF502 domain-containing protein [Bythopirellula polymerisocia]|uniref:DUF502 domain-containing protein n=1 Tax=Bythopirellula polymerisocia TaxID=2528003 RepID=A0A5C6D002_9BACT|nr:DUF502 domain-containing protein [Bythopirellula polymerisocia]TWU30180.1 hypothetical protein Pla144_09660 [Bythopirellula polymerisocia]
METKPLLNKSNGILRVLRTTAIGGLLFLLPLVFVGALIGQVVPIVMSIAESLGTILPDALKSAGGIALLIFLAVCVLLLLCFGAGVLARISLSRRLSEAFEKKVLFLFPKYAILKDQMADSIGGDHARAKMKPVLVHYENVKRIAFETERSDDLGVATVYLPGSPDPWAGKVAIFAADQVEPLPANFGEAVEVCEQLGRGTEKLIKRLSSKIPNDSSTDADQQE